VEVRRLVRDDLLIEVDAVVRITFDELRSTPTRVVLTARAADFGRVVSVFSFEGRRIASIADYPSMEAAESALVQG
jgi:hypothetical protein